MSKYSKKKRDKDKANANVCLSCNKPICDGESECFNMRKKLLNHERTMRKNSFKCRETVERTGDELVGAVTKR